MAWKILKILKDLYVICRKIEDNQDLTKMFQQDWKFKKLYVKFGEFGPKRISSAWIFRTTEVSGNFIKIIEKYHFC